MSKLLLSLPLVSAFVLLSAIGPVAEEGAEAVGFGAWIVPILVIIFLIAVNGLFVAAEFAIIGARPSQLEEMVESGATGAQKILETVESTVKQDRYIATAQLGITIASLGLAQYAEPAIAHLLEPYLQVWFNITDASTLHFVGTYIVVLPILTYLHVVVGEMVPKAISLSSPAGTAIRLNRAMSISQGVLKPLVVSLNFIGDQLLKLLRLPPAQTRIHSPEELEQIVTESAEGGLLNEEEQEIIRNIFDFSDRRVGQVMTPRPRVQAIASDMPYDEMVRYVADSNHTRFPVYEEDRDHIIGILHLRDIIQFSLSGQTEFDVRKLINLAPAVPEDQLVEELLATFKAEHIHMAIVLDEGAGMAGVVTLEDLVEEVVGEVRDEFDVEIEPLIEIRPGLYEVAGDYLVEDLVTLGVFPEGQELPDVETVGGLVVTKLGRPPKLGDIAAYINDVRFEVIAIDGLAVERARLTFPVDIALTPPPVTPQDETDA